MRPKNIKKDKNRKGNTLRFCSDCIEKSREESYAKINNGKKFSLGKKGRWKLLAYRTPNYLIKPFPYVDIPKPKEISWVYSGMSFTVDYIKLKIQERYNLASSVFPKLPRPKYLELAERTVDHCQVPQSELEEILKLDLNDFWQGDKQDDPQWTVIFEDESHLTTGQSDAAIGRFFDQNPQLRNFIVVKVPYEGKGRRFSCNEKSKHREVKYIGFCGLLIERCEYKCPKKRHETKTSAKDSDFALIQ
jgi:hypothetical protein